MRRDLRIATDKLVDAECIACVLSKYEPRVESCDDSWAVVVATNSQSALIPVIFSALKACLDTEAIPAVQVTLDERTYLMEGAPTSR